MQIERVDIGPSRPRLLPAVRYPVTLLLAVQYIALAVIPAVVNSNPQLLFIVYVVSLGLVAAFAVESFVRALPPPREDGRRPRVPTPLGAWSVMGVGALATLVSASLGAGSYAAQVGLTATSPFATLVTPFSPWLVFGCGFGLAAWRGGEMSRRSTLLLIAVALLAQLLAVLRIGISAPLMNLALALGGGLILVGFMRARWLLVGLVGAVLLWPILYDARNTTRAGITGSASAVSVVDAQSRVREDLLLQLAAEVGHPNVAQPDVLQVVRFGLIPRALDPGRGQLPSGKTLNLALGGVSDSATTFTTLGTVWSLNGGYLGVLIYAGVVALVITSLARRLTPTRLALAMLLTSNLLWIEAVYPDDVAGALQGVISLALATALMIALRAASSRSAGSPRQSGGRPARTDVRKRVSGQGTI